jgi:hypothetical protein
MARAESPSASHTGTSPGFARPRSDRPGGGRRLLRGAPDDRPRPRRPCDRRRQGRVGLRLQRNFSLGAAIARSSNSGLRRARRLRRHARLHGRRDRPHRPRSASRSTAGARLSDLYNLVGKNRSSPRDPPDVDIAPDDGGFVLPSTDREIAPPAHLADAYTGASRNVPALREIGRRPRRRDNHESSAAATPRHAPRADLVRPARSTSWGRTVDELLSPPSPAASRALLVSATRSSRATPRSSHSAGRCSPRRSTSSPSPRTASARPTRRRSGGTSPWRR